MKKTDHHAVFSYVFLCMTLHYCTHKEDTRNKINLSCIKSFFTVSGGSRCWYRQMLKIIVCWKVISCCVVHSLPQNIVTLSNKQLHIIPAPQYIIQEARNTHNVHSGVFLTKQTWLTITYKLQKPEPHNIILPGTIFKVWIRNISDICPIQD